MSVSPQRTNFHSTTFPMGKKSSKILVRRAVLSKDEEKERDFQRQKHRAEDASWRCSRQMVARRRSLARAEMKRQQTVWRSTEESHASTSLLPHSMELRPDPSFFEGRRNRVDLLGEIPKLTPVHSRSRVRADRRISQLVFVRSSRVRSTAQRLISRFLCCEAKWTNIFGSSRSRKVRTDARAVGKENSINDRSEITSVPAGNFPDVHE